MIFLNYNLRKIFIVLTGIILLNFLNSCGIWDPADARKVPASADERVKKNLEEGRGITLGGALGGGKKGTSYQFASSNPMWRATLEILDFLPLANVDYSGGIITTDWYNEGTASDEAIKITIRFLSNEIRADGLSVIIHKRICNKFQQCSVAKIESNLVEEIKLAILKTATLLEKGKFEENRKKYKKKYGDRAPRERKSKN